MPRRPDRKQVNITVSAAQHRAALKQASARQMGLSEYVRYCLARDAAALGYVWPDDLLPAKGDK